MPGRESRLSPGVWSWSLVLYRSGQVGFDRVRVMSLATWAGMLSVRAGPDQFVLSPMLDGRVAAVSPLLEEPLNF